MSWRIRVDFEIFQILVKLDNEMSSYFGKIVLFLEIL